MVHSGQIRDATEWAYEQLHGRGLSLVSPPETLRSMPWSAVIKLETAEGAYFLKCSAPGFRREPEVIRLLAAIGVRHVTEVIAASRRLGSFLMPDAGVPFRSVMGGEADIPVIRKTLEAYAALQIGAADNVEDFLEMGVPDRGLARLPELLEELIESGIISDFDQATAEEVDRLRDSLPAVERLCVRLASFGLPATIEHSDFHDNNVLVRGDAVTISDHEAVSISHPFFSLASFLYSLRFRLAPELFPAREAAARSAYLDAWAEYGSHSELQEAVSLAEALSPIIYALGFRNVATSLSAEETRPYRGNMLTALKSLEGLMPEMTPAPRRI